MYRYKSHKKEQNPLTGLIIERKKARTASKNTDTANMVLLKATLNEYRKICTTATRAMEKLKDSNRYMAKISNYDGVAVSGGRQHDLSEVIVRHEEIREKAVTLLGKKWDIHSIIWDLPVSWKCQEYLLHVYCKVEKEPTSWGDKRYLTELCEELEKRVQVLPMI